MQIFWSCKEPKKRKEASLPQN